MGWEKALNCTRFRCESDGRNRTADCVQAIGVLTAFEDELASEQREDAPDNQTAGKTRRPKLRDWTGCDLCKRSVFQKKSAAYQESGS
ncbi:hypothetical protein QWJ34_24155 [Saccharibacillus sp. CPCC 101409]|uniref:hypothetical protein n=1 Tax=Saccharibacillus sp. CPCC 101409 TaxID=3058041 RepID=UPI002671EFA8|nr:hypothetical protein [Saccharibacillus sp. CPCC 101409]MDO3412881.1 hypothetical protein [Saccharibacillus sp. CPCC 101409]